MFSYSERPGTMAARKLKDDIPEKIKKRRLQEIVDLQQKHSLERTKEFLGQFTEVLIEKSSKKTKISVSESYIVRKIEERTEAKKQGDFILADKIRDELLSKGVLIEDQKEKTIWKAK